MLKKVLLNNQEFHFSLSNLPCLIHGAHKAGSSLFTVSMLADLYAQGHKVLFLSGYHMARDEFLAQTNADDVILLENDSDLDIAKNKQVVFVKKENADWFIRLVNELPDISNRVILIKNFDLFNQEVFKKLKDKTNYILSGDLDACLFTESILNTKFTTNIFFSQPKIKTSLTLPKLETYHGYMWGKEHGELKLEIE